MWWLFGVYVDMYVYMIWSCACSFHVLVTQSTWTESEVRCHTSLKNVLHDHWYSYNIYKHYCQLLLLLLIMYIYHALINALSTHMVHINLNMIFYWYIEHNSTQATCTKHHTHTHTHTQKKNYNEFKCVRHWSVSYIIHTCVRAHSHTHTHTQWL